MIAIHRLREISAGCGGALLALGCLAMPDLAVAQEELEAQTGEPPERIDILVERPDVEPRYEDCEDDQDAAVITGEIVVCRRVTGDENRLVSDEEAKNRHAERTKGPMPMDVNLDDRIPAVGVTMTIKGCFIPPCPPPPVLLIDLDAIPETPKGSDADRVGRGLAPRDHPLSDTLEDNGTGLQSDAEALGLPPPLAENEAVSPSGSASPADDPSG